MKTLLSKALDLILAPRGRLQSDFPWSLWSMGKTYLVASLWYYAGAILVPVLVLVLMLGATFVSDDVYAWVQRNVMVPGTDVPSVKFLVWMSVISFVAGFGLELHYIRKVLAKEGRTISGVMALNFNALRGKTKFHTLFNFTYPVVIAWLIWFAIEQVIVRVLGHPVQGTVDLIKQLVGGYFWVFAALACIGAPIAEELVFRGFLFNACRTSFRRGRIAKWLNENVLAADYLAVFVSSAFFAVMHLQFNPITLLMLFVLGCIHAELYRRTGSLYCSMMLHFVNNSLAMLMLWMAR